MRITQILVAVVALGLVVGTCWPLKSDAETFATLANRHGYASVARVVFVAGFLLGVVGGGAMVGLLLGR